MTASDDALARIDLLMHAQGHAFHAADTARLAQTQLTGSDDGQATLALAVAHLADALSGLIDATAQSVSDTHGLTYGKGRDGASDEPVASD